MRKRKNLPKRKVFRFRGKYVQHYGFRKKEVCFTGTFVQMPGDEEIEGYVMEISSWDSQRTDFYIRGIYRKEDNLLLYKRAEYGVSIAYAFYWNGEGGRFVAYDQNEVMWNFLPYNGVMVIEEISEDASNAERMTIKKTIRTCKKKVRNKEVQALIGENGRVKKYFKIQDR